MWKKVIGFLPLIIERLPVDTAKRAIDAALDVIEIDIQESTTKIDDIVILPLIKILRNVANIPDED